MAEKYVDVRHVQKHETEQNWLALAPNFIPKRGEIIVYDVDENYNYERMKIGDGLTLLKDLPFAVITADWAQTDENAPDYIKNKPENLATQEFVKEQIEKIEIVGDGSSSGVSDLFNTLLPKQELAFTVETGLGDEQYAFYGEESSNIDDIEIGKTYKVLWDDIEYTLVAEDLQTIGNFIKSGFLGNSSIYMKDVLGTDGGIDTGEPFFIAVNDDENTLMIASNDTTNTSHTVCIVEAHIDNQYLSILDKKVIETDILPEAIISGFTFLSAFQAYGTSPAIPAAFSLTNGETYIVNWDGETYVCESGIFNYNGDDLVYIGNGEYVGQSGNDEPFLISYSQAYNAHQFFSNVDTDSHIVRIYQTDDVYKIKEECMPDNITGNSGSVLTETEIFAEQTFDFSPESEGANIYKANPELIPLVDNETYFVIWDGVEYIVTARGSSASMIGLGNMSISNSAEDDTCEPFYLVTLGENTAIYTLDTAASHTIRIYQSSLDNKYLSILRRVAGVKAEIFAEQELTFADDGSGSFIYETTPAPFLFVAGDTYSVEWDGTLYPDLLGVVHIAGISAIGNLSFMGLGEDTGEPFIFMTQDMNGSMFGIMTPDTSTTHTVSVTHRSADTLTLKEEHIGNVDYETKIVNKPFGQLAEGAIVTDYSAQYDSNDFGFVLTNMNTYESHVNDKIIMEEGTYSVEIAGVTYEGVGMTAEAIKQLIPSLNAETFSGVGIAIYQDGNLWGALASFQNVIWFVWPITGGAYTHGESYQVKITVVEAIKKIDAKYMPDTIAPKELILTSSTEGSTKRFRITVDDSGTITTVEVQ